MSWIKTIGRELFGLFVDDGSFAVIILAWLAIVAMLLPRLGLPSPWHGIVLFAGLALIFIESATRRARR